MTTSTTDPRTHIRDRKGRLTAAALRDGHLETRAWIEGDAPIVVTLEHDAGSTERPWLVTRKAMRPDPANHRLVTTTTQTWHDILNEARAALVRAAKH